MPYEPTVWKNREVERPRTYTKVENPDGTITLIPQEGNIIEPGTPIIAENMNKIEQGIKEAHELIGDTVSKEEFNEHLADLAYQVAGGTPTAIELNIDGALTDGRPFNFIASANGTVTTVNGKPLYKPNTTTNPTLKAGKPYTIYYSVSSDCFFLRASAEGNASVEHVLAGKTFSNDDDTGLEGSMPNNGNQTATLSISGSSKPIKTIPAGYTTGGTITAQLSPSLAGQIVAGNTIGGVSGIFYPLFNFLDDYQAGAPTSHDKRVGGRVLDGLWFKNIDGTSVVNTDVNLTIKKTFGVAGTTRHSNNGVSDDEIAFYNHNTNTVSVYNHDGTLIKTFSPTVPGYDYGNFNSGVIGITENRFFMSVQESGGSQKYVLLFNKNGVYIDSIYHGTDSLSFIVSRPLHVALCTGTTSPLNSFIKESGERITGINVMDLIRSI